MIVTPRRELRALGPVEQLVDVLGIAGNVVAFIGIAWVVGGFLLLDPLLRWLALDPTVPHAIHVTAAGGTYVLFVPPLFDWLIPQPQYGILLFVGGGLLALLMGRGRGGRSIFALPPTRPAPASATVRLTMPGADPSDEDAARLAAEIRAIPDRELGSLARALAASPLERKVVTGVRAALFRASSPDDRAQLQRFLDAMTGARAGGSSWTEPPPPVQAPQQAAAARGPARRALGIVGAVMIGASMVWWFVAPVSSWPAPLLSVPVGIVGGLLASARGWPLRR